MPDVLTQSHLDRNLACLGESNADIASALRAVEPARDLEWDVADDGLPTASYRGRRLASRRRPREEAERIADRVDLENHATVVVLGFGLGHHVREVARRADRTAVLVVFEPDLSLLRAVFERIDCSGWLREALVVFAGDERDRAALAAKLGGAEAIIAQGVTFLEHPASRSRLGERAGAFSKAVGEFVLNAKTTLLTTLVRSADTIQNLLWNLDHYATGPGIADLEGAAAGFPAVIVSAGPSLHRNIRLLAQPGVRERCVIIAVQTTLKPLLQAGVRPPFVTALDYHEISKRFYEGLTEQDVEGVTLIADPKAHPVIIDSFPGTVRCCASSFLDRLLGAHARDMGTLPAGATVAHLAFYLAEYLGCDPIAFIGQDLGFTDGLYYAPGTAIHDVWAPELNPFNTIEMMEWQRIVRHRTHLHKTEDHEGKSIYTDAQMLNYLQQFERDFARAAERGARVIDATEGGAAKQHTERAALADVLDRFATRPLPDAIKASSALQPAPERIDRVAQRVDSIRRDTVRLESISRKTGALLETMLESQDDPAAMERHFRALDRLRAEVEKIFEVFELLNQFNQLAVFKRQRADRKIHLAKSRSAVERQRAQLERDLENVRWTSDAAAELARMLADAERLLAEGSADWKRPADEEHAPHRLVEVKNGPRTATRVAAMLPVDLERNALGVGRSLAEPFRGRAVIQATLERLGRSSRLERIILLASRDADVERLIDRSAIALPVDIERCDGSPFGREREAVAAARLWADTCWRGGIAGMSAYDEALCPRPMHEAMQRRGLDAAVVLAPDWPLVDVSADAGVDALVARFRSHPDRQRLVFSQSPPGLGACLVNRALMEELAERNRASTAGAMLVYQPHAPQADPVAREANVQIDHRVRRSLARYTFDAPRWRTLIEHAGGSADDPVSTVEAAEKLLDRVYERPQHFLLEICVERSSAGLLASTSAAGISRGALTLDAAERTFAQIGEIEDAVVTFDGVGDPLLHPQFDRLIAMAKECGVCAVHVRTELRCDRAVLDRLAASPVDIVSVDLHADRAAVYQRMMGDDRFRDVLMNIDALAGARRRLTDHPGNAAFALPWIVPVLRRCRATYEDVDSFYDRWLTVLGAAAIEGGRPGWDSDDPPLAPAVTPQRVLDRERARRMTILSDGRVPADAMDVSGENVVGDVREESLEVIWERCERRLGEPPHQRAERRLGEPPHQGAAPSPGLGEADGRRGNA